MSVGVMSVGVMSVGEITAGVMTVGVMTFGVMRRPHSNHASWFSSIKFISNKIAQFLDLKNNKISNAILNKFFINEWNKNKEKFSDGKLSTYLTVKNNFGFEKYLDKIKNFEQRRTLTRFRISAHKLAIETGRYKGIPRHDRICTRCTDNTVEDERHFLMFK